MEKHGIHYHEKKFGQLFCDGSSQQIIDLLRHECNVAGVEWFMPCQVKNVNRADIKDNFKFLLETDRGTLTADSLVIATGGLSIQKSAPLLLDTVLLRNLILASHLCEQDWCH